MMETLRCDCSSLILCSLYFQGVRTDWLWQRWQYYLWGTYQSDWQSWRMYDWGWSQSIDQKSWQWQERICGLYRISESLGLSQGWWRCKYLYICQRFNDPYRLRPVGRHQRRISQIWCRWEWFHHKRLLSTTIFSLWHHMTLNPRWNAKGCLNNV